jgi:hypothetical protein
MGMRGLDEGSGSLFSDVDLEARIPSGHPSRARHAVVNEALASLAEAFERLYAPSCRLRREPALPQAHRGKLRLGQDHLAKTRRRGLARVGWMFTLAVAANDLIRVPRLLAPA